MLDISTPTNRIYCILYIVRCMIKSDNYVNQSEKTIDSVLQT